MAQIVQIVQQDRLKSGSSRDDIVNWIGGLGLDRGTVHDAADGRTDESGCDSCIDRDDGTGSARHKFHDTAALQQIIMCRTGIIVVIVVIK